MLEGPSQPQSSVEPLEQGDRTHLDIADGPIDSVPVTIKIDLEIDPVAYRYESWSEMADGWVESLRSSAETIPDADHKQIRNVTPLVPLSDVEAFLERMGVSEEVIMSHERPGATRDTPPP